MQTKLIPKELRRQSMPKENLVMSEPVQSRQKLVNQYNKTMWDSSSPRKNILRQIISKAPYPDFRYFCTFCGSLDVFIKVDKVLETIQINCLDCNDMSDPV